MNRLEGKSNSLSVVNWSKGHFTRNKDKLPIMSFPSEQIKKGQFFYDCTFNQTSTPPNSHFVNFLEGNEDFNVDEYNDLLVDAPINKNDECEVSFTFEDFPLINLKRDEKEIRSVGPGELLSEALTLVIQRRERELLRMKYIDEDWGGVNTSIRRPFLRHSVIPSHSKMFPSQSYNNSCDQEAEQSYIFSPFMHKILYLSDQEFPLSITSEPFFTDLIMKVIRNHLKITERDEPRRKSAEGKYFGKLSIPIRSKTAKFTDEITTFYSQVIRKSINTYKLNVDKKIPWFINNNARRVRFEVLKRIVSNYFGVKKDPRNNKIECYNADAIRNFIISLVNAKVYIPDTKDIFCRNGKNRSMTENRSTPMTESIEKFRAAAFQVFSNVMQNTSLKKISKPKDAGAIVKKAFDNLNIAPHDEIMKFRSAVFKIIWGDSSKLTANFTFDQKTESLITDICKSHFITTKSQRLAARNSLFARNSPSDSVQLFRGILKRKQSMLKLLSTKNDKTEETQRSTGKKASLTTFRVTKKKSVSSRKIEKKGLRLTDPLLYESRIVKTTITPLNSKRIDRDVPILQIGVGKMRLARKKARDPYLSLRR